MAARVSGSIGSYHTWLFAWLVSTSIKAIYQTKRLANCLVLPSHARSYILFIMQPDKIN